LQILSQIGTITPGKEVDIIMLATDPIKVFPLNNAPGAVVTLMDTSNVEHVFIAGKVMNWYCQLVNVDLNRIRRLTGEGARRASHPGEISSRPVWVLPFSAGYRARGSPHFAASR
jgi:hypothetical protein